jgi:hypothetical protein
LDIDNDVLYGLAKFQYKIGYSPVYTKMTNYDQLGSIVTIPDFEIYLFYVAQNT